MRSNQLRRERFGSAVSTRIGFGVVVLAGISALGTGEARAADCASLANTSIPFTTITQVQLVTGGSFTPPVTTRPITGLPDFCRVAMTIKPSGDSNIRAEVWLPTGAWNGRFRGEGCGGLCGSITYSALATGIKLSYVTATTDMGTSPGGDGSALTGHPEKFLDYFPRSTHYMTVAGKMLLNAFYGTYPAYSYYNGCSTGGAQGFGEAQVYPNDYDAMVAGTPGYNRTHIIEAFAYVGQQVNTGGATPLSSAKLNLLHNAVINAPQCQAAKGSPGDPFFNDPKLCNFDPASLLCSGSDTTNCLTPGEVLAAKAQYAGMTKPGTTDLIYSGWPKGTEIGPSTPWTAIEQTTTGYNGYPLNWALGNGFDFLTVDWSKAVDIVDGTSGIAINPGSSDLSRFIAHGGKMISYWSLSDALAPFPDVINYFDRLASENGKKRSEVDNYARLFLVPNGNHCPTNFDAFQPLVDWHEKGIAPDTIPASYTVAGVTSTRPLCLYPKKQAEVNGQWQCVAGTEGGYGVTAPRYTQPLVLTPHATPAVINMGAQNQPLRVEVDASQGPENFQQWVPSDIKVEGVPVDSYAVSHNGDKLTVVFSKSAIANFTGGKPPGQPVELTLSGTLAHAGVTGPFATGVTVQLLR